MMYELLIYSLILGLVFGGSLKKLWNIDLKGFPFIMISVVSLAVTNWMRRSTYLPTILSLSFIEQITSVIYFLAFFILLVFVWINRNEKSLLLVGIGILLNMIVIFSNGAKMPVEPVLAQAFGLLDKISYLETHGFYTLANSNTRFYYLADVIKNPFLTSYIVSLGDFFISGGLFIFVIQKMRQPQNESVQK
ncbi:hypothetical protein SANA_32210 [Gottschalkiaceae bacterium SANA]|nr:hypothetical protein SANA_32210 [Gottschalkiaceae bacterium SANA]